MNNSAMMGNTTDNVSDLCSKARMTSDRYELKIMYILECIFGLIAIFPNLTTLTLLWRVKVFHANLRLILANLSMNLLIVSFTIPIKAFQRLTEDVCTFPMPLKSCMWRDYFVVIPLHNALISLVILNLERLYATIRYRSYDYAGHVPFLGMFLLVCAWTTSLVLNIPGYFQAPNFKIPLCELALVGSPQGVMTVIITMASFEGVAAVITFFVYVYNQYILTRMTINRARYDLSARFQVNQNKQLNTALMPGMVLHMVSYMPSYIFLSLVFVKGGQLKDDTKAWLLHLTYVWRLLYAMVDPVLLITLNASLRQALRKTAFGGLLVSLFRCFRKRNSEKTHDMAAKSRKVMKDHFDYLQQAWAAQKPPICDSN